MSFVLEELGEEDADVRTLNAIRQQKILDHEKALEMVKGFLTETDDVSKVDRAYALGKFDDTPNVWEPKAEVEKRFYRGLEYVIRSFIKYQKEQGAEKTPHLVAVSHFEFLNHFAAEVFGLDLEKDNLVGFTEMIEMEVLEPGQDNPNEIPIRVSFRGQSKDIIFNRESRSITIL
jgi:hypothetical protein